MLPPPPFSFAVVNGFGLIFVIALCCVSFFAGAYTLWCTEQALVQGREQEDPEESTEPASIEQAITESDTVLTRLALWRASQWRSQVAEELEKLKLAYSYLRISYFSAILLLCGTYKTKAVVFSSLSKQTKAQEECAEAHRIRIKEKDAQAMNLEARIKTQEEQASNATKKADEWQNRCIELARMNSESLCVVSDITAKRASDQRNAMDQLAKKQEQMDHFKDAFKAKLEAAEAGASQISKKYSEAQTRCYLLDIENQRLKQRVRQFEYDALVNANKQLAQRVLELERDVEQPSHEKNEAGTLLVEGESQPPQEYEEDQHKEDEEDEVSEEDEGDDESQELDEEPHNVSIDVTTADPSTPLVKRSITFSAPEESDADCSMMNITAEPTEYDEEEDKHVAGEIPSPGSSIFMSPPSPA